MSKLPPKTFATVNGKRMAYVKAGVGDAIIFQHGNHTSSYLWRNIMPHCEGIGRLIACDLIGMGDSDKLENYRPNRYTYAEHREYLYALWEEIGLGSKVIFVLHDWGSALGANRHRERVQGVAYMEAIVTPLSWGDWPENARRIFQALRSDGGEEMILEKNVFVERVLPNSIIRRLTEDEMAAYCKPFVNSGEDRRPTLTWPRMIPIDGERLLTWRKSLRNMAPSWPRPMLRSSSLTRTRARYSSVVSGNFAERGQTKPRSPSGGIISCRRTVPMTLARQLPTSYVACMSNDEKKAAGSKPETSI
jgi:haloalkane dehalogenase